MDSTTSSASSSLYHGGASPCLNSDVTTTKNGKRKSKNTISKAKRTKPITKKKKKVNNKKAVKKKDTVELSEEEIATKKKRAQSKYKCVALQRLRDEFYTKITMELFNGSNIEMSKFDEICSLVKELKVGKTLEFNNLLVFGDGNSGNYLYSKFQSVCVIVVIYVCINIDYYFCSIIVEKDGVEYQTIDKARVQAIIKNKLGVLHDDYKPVNDFVMDLLEPFFACMPDLDRERIHISVLMTMRANIGQVDHFDWDKFKVENSEKDGKFWKVQDSVSIIIQLSGEL